MPLFYPIVDTGSIERRGLRTVEVVEEILEAGARIVQLRHKGFFSREVYAAAQHIAYSCRQAGATFVIDDRADIAALLDAGVHLGQNDLSPSDARRITGPECMLGFSTHNAAQLRAAEAEPADYLAIGPIFATSSKLNPDPIVGVENLKPLRALTTRPLVAIGGITRSNARAVIEAGADSVAIISDLYPDSGRIRDRASEWLSILAPDS